ncbi:hypothetical protein [Marinomonas gallaica]|uniref:hypothetical protein n=1 Tax=Marinomonas gallaica TaxID=1806667 RepID=UPI003A93405C
MTFFVLLIIATAVSTVMLLGSVWWYWRVKKQLENEPVEKDEQQDTPESNDTEVASDGSVEVSVKDAWLDLIDQQKDLCNELLTTQNDNENEDLTLRCWQTFLEVERILIQDSHANVADYLDKFEFVLERLKQAQEIDALLKQLSVSNQLLKQLNKVIQKTGDAAFEQMNTTANLNLKLDGLQDKLHEELELDQELADVRAELASLHEFAGRLKQKMESKSDHDKEYLDTLSEFLGSASSDSFLAPIKSELDDKVVELQSLADYRTKIIEELKVRLKSKRVSKDGRHVHLAEYDVAFAKMEKSLLESNKVIKALEQKLESLQTIKYNLNVDVRKREEELKAKDAKLRESRGDVPMQAQASLAREQDSVNAIVESMDKVPFSPEYSDFEAEQSVKLASLQELVNESELYVNVLERDLERAKIEHDRLTDRLESGDEVPLMLSSQEKEELENLREINSELESEKISLIEQLSVNSEDTEAVQELQQKIKELDMKIETVQVNYVNMEERYLNSLMS